MWKYEGTTVAKTTLKGRTKLDDLKAYCKDGVVFM